MKYMIVFLLIASCGWKPMVSCKPDVNMESTMSDVAQSCIEQPQMAIKKEF